MFRRYCRHFQMRRRRRGNTSFHLINQKAKFGYLCDTPTMVSTPSKHAIKSDTERTDVLCAPIRPVYSVRKKTRFSTFPSPNLGNMPPSSYWKGHYYPETIVEGQFDDALEESPCLAVTNADGSAVKEVANCSHQLEKVNGGSPGGYSKAASSVESGKGTQTSTTVDKYREKKKAAEINGLNDSEVNSMVTPARVWRPGNRKSLISDPLFSSPEEDSSTIPTSTDTFSIFGCSLKNVPSAFSNTSFDTCRLSNERHILGNISGNTNAPPTTHGSGVVCVALGSFRSPLPVAKLSNTEAKANENGESLERHATLDNASEKENEPEGKHILISEDTSKALLQELAFPEAAKYSGISDVDYPRTEHPSKENIINSRRFADRPCKCTKSRCLKLYCDCFQRGLLCDGSVCMCIKCQNTEEHCTPMGARTKAIKVVFSRRSDAFEKRVKKEGEGCSCKKNRCLKLYCNCKWSQVLCTKKCKCMDCHNTVGAAENSKVSDTDSYNASVTADDEAIQATPIKLEHI